MFTKYIFTIGLLVGMSTTVAWSQDVSAENHGKSWYVGLGGAFQSQSFKLKSSTGTYDLNLTATPMGYLMLGYEIPNTNIVIDTTGIYVPASDVSLSGVVIGKGAVGHASLSVLFKTNPNLKLGLGINTSAYSGLNFSSALGLTGTVHYDLNQNWFLRGEVFTATGTGIGAATGSTAEHLGVLISSGVQFGF